MHDLVITGGTVIDGSGAPGVAADVAVDDGRIVEVGRLGTQAARRTIRADGMVVAPGFIDLHAHSDLVLLADPAHHLKVLQGVTTELLGQDGLSYAPIAPAALPVMRDMITAINGAPDVAYDWTSVAEYLALLAAARPAVNAAYLVPHGALRLSVTGMADRVATDDEVAAMARMAAAGMADGALGFSSGLTYPPATWSDTRELVAIARAVAPRHGIYVTHHRDYGPRLMASVEEALTIGRDGGVPVHFSHFHISGQPYAGRAGEFLDRIDRERAGGGDVTLDTYPYLAGSTFLGAWIPAHIMTGTTDEAIARLADPARRELLVAEIEAGPRDYVYTEWGDFQLSGIGSPAHQDLLGLRLPAAAARRGIRLGELIRDLLVASRMNVTILAFTGVEENVRRVMQDPGWTVGTDAILVGSSVHPRASGTYPTVLGTYARAEGVISLERAVNAMTGAPAARIGLVDRGLVRPGLAADLVVFDPATVAARSTYEDSRRPPAGMPYVLVNGVPVKWDDAPTDARPGRIIRGDGTGRARAA
ncbi:MAG: N-acyl-D-amino-acid deacylase family protein [Chloroflexota bacterium]